MDLESISDMESEWARALTEALGLYRGYIEVVYMCIYIYIYTGIQETLGILGFCTNSGKPNEKNGKRGHIGVKVRAYIGAQRRCRVKGTFQCWGVSACFEIEEAYDSNC